MSTAGIWERLSLIEDPLKRRLLFVGWLTEQLAGAGVVPIVVGGHALEFYTLGEYTTGDVDLIVADREKAAQVLEEAGFTREGRHWYRADVNIAVEIPGETLAGEESRVETVEVEGFKVHIIGKEDLLIDRLNACVHWRSESDCFWARMLIELYGDRMDWGYLEKRAREEGTWEKLRELRGKADAVR